VYYRPVVARIRIIDEWLRSPVSPAWRHRAVMVVAESWSEQRVLMRAFAACSDQTRPTIVLHGVELAIGPAGVDAHGEWGIHVEPPVDGRAQELRAELELAARRLAGTRGNPPRLVDEVSRFDNKATHLWAPGTRPATPSEPPPMQQRVGARYYEPAEAVARASRPMLVAHGGHHAAVAPPDHATVLSPMLGAQGPALASVSPDALTAPSAPIGTPPAGSIGARTQRGFLPADPGPARAAALTGPMSAAQSHLPAAPGQGNQLTFASLVGRTMPLGLQLTQSERDVLDALGRAPVLSADQVGRIAGASDPVSWMDRFVRKLGELGLDLVVPGVDRAGEPTYALRR
jgi:hypothetical protein